MKNTRFNKSQLPSRHVTEGPARAPHRSYFYAMGITEEEIHSPWVGVATCWNEAAPCNIALARQAQSVKQGVKKGGGCPREFTTITVTDKGNGKYDVVFNNIINKDGSYEDNYGTFTFSDLDGVTANGITTIEGKLLTGAVTSSGMGISSIGVTDVFVKMNDEKAYATMDGLITMFSRDTQLKVEFGEDDFPAASTDKVVGEDGYQPAGNALLYVIR